jgi:DNA-binding FrmR family transcriptional regulator
MSNTNPELQQAMCKRLARVEGQLRGIQKLIVADADCEKVIQQMTAARKALDKAFYEMLACVIEHQVLDDRGKKSADTMRDVRDLLAKYA